MGEVAQDLGKGGGRRQINVPLAERDYYALKTIATVDDLSLPSLLEPVVADYVHRRLQEPEVAEAVEAVRKARQTKGHPDRTVRSLDHSRRRRK